MRRLPIFLVVDVSESMIGENLEQMQDGVRALTQALRTDPHALETVHVGVLAFAGIARTLVPLTEIGIFEAPRLPIGSGTSLGAGLDLLMTTIDRDVVPTSPDRKGDWKPLVFLFTDGKPTDAYDKAATRWSEKYATRAEFVAVALGRFADVAALERLASTTLILEKTGANELKSLIRWVTASVMAYSRSVGSGEQVSLAKVESPGLRLVKPTDRPVQGRVDPDYVILTGRCRRDRAPYLMKYERVADPVHRIGERSARRVFAAVGCYGVTEAYFEWSGTAAPPQSVSTQDLLGAPACPHCNSRSAFAACGCGNLLCIDGPGEVTCPWCRCQATFEASGGDFNVNRQLG